MQRSTDEPALDFMPPAFAFLSQPEQQHLAADDDEDDDDDDDEGDDDEGDEDGDDDDERSPEEVRAELKKAAARIKRLNAESKRHRLRAREARDAAAKPKPKPKGDDGDDDVDARIAAATAETTAKAELRIKRVEAKSALGKAGVADDRLARAVKLLDLDDLAVDDDGVLGLDDAIDSLRDDFPELFDKPRRRRRSGAEGNDRDGKGGSGPKTEKSASQRQAEALLGTK